MTTTEYPMFIAGSPVRTGEKREVRIPYDGSAAGTIYQAGPEQVNAAIEAALEAFPKMRAMSRHERSSILYRAHAILKERSDEMARAVASEAGKPIREARI